MQVYSACAAPCFSRQPGVAPRVQPPIQSASHGGNLEAFLVSLGIVALAEIGDKTQLLALVLAARYRRPVPVILGIFVATLANHALAAWLGAGVAGVIGRDALRWSLGLSFLAMAAWALVPDKLEKEKPQGARLGAFAATLVAFFLVTPRLRRWSPAPRSA